MAVLSSLMNSIEGLSNEGIDGVIVASQVKSISKEGWEQRIGVRSGGCMGGNSREFG